jgi:hypothetical protein
MRLVLLLASLAVVAVAVVLAVGRGDGSSADNDRVSAVTLVGDSLNEGIEAYVEFMLQGWTIRTRNESGRRTPDGVDVLREEGDDLEPYVVISLGTNDGREDASGFRRNVRAALRIVGPDRCVVWINLADAYGPFEPLNAVLEEEADRVDNLRVVDWAGMVAENPDWLAADGIHASDFGYAKRAEAVADAVRACPEPELRAAG